MKNLVAYTFWEKAVIFFHMGYTINSLEVTDRHNTQLCRCDFSENYNRCMGIALAYLLISLRAYLIGRNSSHDACKNVGQKDTLSFPSYLSFLCLLQELFILEAFRAEKSNGSGILQDCRMSILENLKHTRRACGHGDMGTGPHQVFAATLTLFQPGVGGSDYAHRILVSPPSF